jgi:flagellar hook-length control protein FliK
MSMTLSPLETPSRTATSAKTDLSDSAGHPSQRPAQSEFGLVMSEVLQSGIEIPPLPAGQEVAAVPQLQAGWPGALGGNVSPALGGDFLKAVHLGPHMNVITSEAAVPDEQSLEAFARSQGLDETAVQWLMGNSPVVNAPPLLAGLSGEPAGGGALSVGAIDATGQAHALAPPTSGQTTWPNGQAHLSSGANSPLSTGMAPIGLANPEPAVEPLAPPLLVTPATAPFADANISQSKADGSLTPLALTAAALWAMTQGTDKARVPTPGPEDPAEVAKVQINLMASPAPAAFWVLRNPLAAAPAKDTATPASGTSWSESEIDLSQAATPEILDSLMQALTEGAGDSGTATASDHPLPLSGQPAHRVDGAAAARQNALNPDTPAPTPESGYAQRSENVQNLAEKMGQAVGQRILSEMEKGQWHLKLSLRPATLGHIEVEMRMRSGELDAVFTAPQALTRELLQEGMSKLKDTLSQMGMDVASMQVGDGQTQKRGGDSTPGQMSKSANDSADDPQSSLSAAQAPAPRMKMGQDGWDVLV